MKKKQERLEIIRVVLVYLLIVATVGIIALLAFHAGKEDNGLSGYVQSNCSDVIAMTDGRILCEVEMGSRNDKVIVYKAKGTYNQQ